MRCFLRNKLMISYVSFERFDLLKFNILQFLFQFFQLSNIINFATTRFLSGSETAWEHRVIHKRHTV